MKTSFTAVGSMLILAITANASFAGELNSDTDNTLNVFVSGTPAVAADVNDNFEKVADAVNDNNDRIDTNTTSINANASAITTLQAGKLNSADLGTALGTATTTAGNSVDGNAADITINGAAIAVHTTTLNNHEGRITANEADITSNTAAIIVNTADIADNTANIAANTTAIAGKLSTSALDAALDTATTTAGNSIDGNAADIALKADLADVENLQQNSNQNGVACAGNDVDDEMVRVGPLCVDKYEASVWDTADGTGTQYGASTTDDFPCSNNGNDCSASAANPIYARSVAGATPSSSITWFQAAQACANSGKRLLTNAEWQMTAAGTPDPGAAGSDTVNFCNTNTAGKVASGSSSGGTEPCVSNWGAYDMTGNLNEWVADWTQGTGTVSVSNANTATYGSDSALQVTEAVNQNDGDNFAASIYRGGGFGGGTGSGIFAFSAAFAPSSSAVSIGFRCAR